MTAVAPPPNFQNRWSGPNGTSNGGDPLGAEDYRMYMPRKNTQRSNSSSSLSSQASSTSTTSTISSQTNGTAPASTSESAWATRKKPRGLWPASKTEPVSGITNARPQSVASAGAGSSAASAMTALHGPAPMIPSQHNGPQPLHQNGISRVQGQDAQAILHLIPMNGTFERKTIQVPFFPDVLRIGRQTNNKTIPTPQNGYFDSKVLSRQHAEIWADRNGKVWIRDVKSSNGTFVNGQRLSQENRDSDPHELREQDMLELGIDIVSEDQKTIVHHKVAARVEHAGIYPNASGNILDLNFGELDGSQLSNYVGPGHQQQLAQMRGRTPSQSAMNGQRLPGQASGMNMNPGNVQPPRHPNFWLQPITMEQVVKKLTTEMKAARQQSQDLQQTHQYINAILFTDLKKEAIKASSGDVTKISPVKDASLKTRFPDPPAPPPQQPLPAKPDASGFSSLKRANTERPKSIGSPIRSETQMSALAEALHNAKKEVETQSLRMRDLEVMLSEERRAREEAEERANRLERERQGTEVASADETELKSISRSENTDTETISGNGHISPTLPDAATSRLQQRLDLMIAEMNEVRQQMEKYRERAESAEADRQSLADMIESIRQDNAEKANRKARRRSHSSEMMSTAVPPAGSEDDDETEEGEIMIINEDAEGNSNSDNSPARMVPDGQHTNHKDANGSTKSSSTVVALTTRKDSALTQSAPAVSILAVVALGVAVMAYLNNLPKLDR